MSTTLFVSFVSGSLDAGLNYAIYSKQLAYLTNTLVFAATEQAWGKSEIEHHIVASYGI